MKPACLITNQVPDYREEPFRLLCEREDVEVVTWAHPGPAPAGLHLRRTTQRGAVRLAASGRYRAVVCGIGGRLALPGAYLTARRQGLPFVLWATLWAHPRTPAHALSWLPMRGIYRRADAVATYGPHVSRYVAAMRGRAEGVFEAPQSVSAELFGRQVGADERAAARETVGNPGFLALFVGRLEPEKGVQVLLDAWRRASLPDAALAFAGEGPLAARLEEPGVHALGRVPRDELPVLYAAADALVLPSIRTATFLEPWGLVVNEAMHQGTPIIASDAVGAVAGGLVREGRNGLVTPAGDSGALASRLETLARNRDLRERLGRTARQDVAPYTAEAWVDGMRRALEFAGSARVVAC
jgi:glycosyltransferase involved in cell wall biosynthesis